jgi:ubiquinone/menaquinone biosynthesis C-methylase UbiE
MKEFVANVFYRIFKIIHKLKLVKPHIISDKSLSLEERDEKYFWYEVKKSTDFDQKFNLSLNNKTVVEVGCGRGGYMYHSLISGVKYIFGVDVDKRRVEKNIELLHKYYEGSNHDISDCGAENMQHINDASVDVVVSDACIEHIRQRDLMFKEIHRVLKPGGYAYICTSPIWLTWNGGHLFKYIPMPWSHLLMPDSVIVEILKLQKKNKDFPEDALDNMINCYSTIGKLTIKKLKKEVARSGYELVSFQNYSRNKIKSVLNKLPVLEEFFAGNIQVKLKKT